MNLGTDHKNSLFKLLRLTPKSLRLRMVYELFAMILISIMEILIMVLVVPLLSTLTTGETNSQIFESLFNALGFSSPDGRITALCTTLLFFYLIKSIITSLATYSQIQFSQKFEESISRSLLISIISQPYEFHLSNNSSILINKVSKEVDQIKKTLISLFAAFTESLIVLALLGFVLINNPLGSIGSVFVVLLSGALFLRMTKNRLVQLGLKLNKESALANQHLIQSLHGIKEIKIRSLDRYFVNRYITSNTIYKRTEGSYLFISRLPAIAFELIAILGLITSIFLLYFTKTDHSSVTQSLGILVAVSFRLIPSSNRIIVGLNDLKYSRNSIESTVKMIENSDRSSERIRIEHFSNKIEFKNVAYAYASEESPVVENLSFTIKTGEKIGIIGESGSGKSTVLDLLLGLIQPNKGSISIDDRKFDGTRMRWGKVIGYVAQNTYLADDTLRNNVAFGFDPLDISESRVNACIELSHLSRIAHEDPAGLNQILGEHGSKISGGEKQRIGIARCIYQDPEIIVLDEATSALDSATEQIVMNNLFNLQPGKTFIIVAHRLATIAKCDKVLLINGGTIRRILVGEEIATYISEAMNL
jgi:ABC-type multidrug transport system fused ATPase/permease subunit